MDSSYHSYLRGLEADRIVGTLQKQQHVNPHQSVGSAICAAQTETGFCQRAGELAMAVLHLDPQRKIGRLKGSELTQLARTIYRLWQQPQPA